MVTAAQWVQRPNCKRLRSPGIDSASLCCHWRAGTIRQAGLWYRPARLYRLADTEQQQCYCISRLYSSSNNSVFLLFLSNNKEKGFPATSLCTASEIMIYNSYLMRERFLFYEKSSNFIHTYKQIVPGIYVYLTLASFRIFPFFTVYVRRLFRPTMIIQDYSQN